MRPNVRTALRSKIKGILVFSDAWICKESEDSLFALQPGQMSGFVSTNSGYRMA